MVSKKKTPSSGSVAGTKAKKNSGKSKRGEPLVSRLQLLLLVLRVGVDDRIAQKFASLLNVRFLSGSIEHNRVVLGDSELLASAQHAELGSLQLEANLR